MRLIYIDEAGISAKEPVVVVVAVIIEADTQWRAVENEINAVFDRWVPAEFREGFIFHGMEVYSGGKFRGHWEFSDRLNFFKDFLSITMRMRLPISLGMVDRRHEQIAMSMGELTSEKIDYAVSYGNCVSRADKYLRVYSKNNELGVVVAEDSPGMKKYLKSMHEILRDSPIELTGEMLNEWSRNKTEVLSITNIVDCPHFVEKSDSIMLQLADAYAFAFRRYFSDLKNGDDLIYSVWGQQYASRAFNREQWGKPSSGSLLFAKWW